MANSAEHWNEAWSNTEAQAWRDQALEPVYERILQLAPKDRPIIDLGGGVGHFAARAKEAGFDVEVWEHNEAAVESCRAKGIPAQLVNLEHGNPPWEFLLPEGATVVATEVLEHLSDNTLGTILYATRRIGGVGFFSVPNDRLTPAEEPEHLSHWTALGYLNMLRSVFGNRARVEVLGHPANLPKSQFPSDRGQPANLLGVVGFSKPYTMSMTMPVRDEEADIEKTLASFRGVADEIVIGIDPRSKDRTREIAEKYADVVFELTDLRGPPDKPEEWVDEKGIHFAHARNQCIAKCTSDWIFMTEGHEPLWKGQDILLNLHHLDCYEHVRVVGVLRTNGKPMMRQQWVFPWLHRKDSRVKFERATHNALDWPEEYLYVTLPGVKTLHERIHTKEVDRQAQRKVQNRKALHDDWIRRGSEYSLHYLGAEWREWDRERAIRYFKEYMAIATDGALKYQTRLILAKELLNVGRPKELLEVLHGAEQDDWTRNEHWIFLGDLCAMEENWERALVYYKYAATMLGGPPVSAWFVDLAFYGWLLTQRIVECYAEMGMLDEALGWAEKTLNLLVEDEAPEVALNEARNIIERIQEARNERQDAAE